MLSREAVSVLEYVLVHMYVHTYLHVQYKWSTLRTLYIYLNSSQQRMTEFLLILRAWIHDDFTMG